MTESRSSTSVILGGRCNLTCTVCDCRDAPAPVDADGVPDVVRAGGHKLVLRGEPSVDKGFARTLEVARGKWAEVTVRTNGHAYADPARAEALRARGVRAVVLPVFAHVAKVHDAVAGREGALVATLRAMRALADAGLAVSIEVPILPPRLQNLDEVVKLAARAVPSLASVRFYVPTAVQPPVLAPPPWSAVRGNLLRAVSTARAAGASVELREFDAVPLCVLGHDAEGETLYRFNPRKPVRARSGFVRGAACERCAVASYCPGTSASYRAANGEADLLPFAAKPRRMFEQRTTARRTWDAGQREAARQVNVRVLRPTVNCNQDCPFCSANETSDNVYADRDAMLKRIARVARQGLVRLSFGGGEPTLSKDLVDYVRAASRLGVPEIELVTNGVLIDTPAKVKPLREAGVNYAFVSLHAHDEILSRRMTSKVGDWERTVRSVDAMLDAGITVWLNHVINAVNYPYLPRFAQFVTERWPGRVAVSFAFVTPQFRALENISLVPRLSDVAPYLRRAMAHMEKLRQQFVVGSRQGVPPCLLGEFQGFSDVLALSANALSEDVPQKTRGPKCDTCRYTRVCTGLWKQYAARYGYDELEPVRGEPFSDDEVAAVRAVLGGWKPVVSFEQVPEMLRMREREGVEQPLPEVPPAPPPQRPRVALPVVSASASATPTRALRIALLGTGPHAERLLRAAHAVPGLEVVGAASPHVRDRAPGPFAGLDLDNDAAALLDRVKPDAALVASATIAHHALAMLCAARKIPALIEKPLAQSITQADEIVRAAEAGDWVAMCGHGMLYTPGVRALRDAAGERAFGRVQSAGCVRRATAASPEALPTWSREGLYQVLYHSAYLLASVTGGGEGAVARVDARGADKPEWIRAELTYPSGCSGVIELDFAAPSAGAELWARGEQGHALHWRREGADESLTRDTEIGERTASLDRRGNDLEGMLAAFRDAARSGAVDPPANARAGRDAMATAQAVVAALASHLVRPGAPRHAASRELR